MKLETLTIDHEHCPFINECSASDYGSAEECKTYNYAACKNYYNYVEDFLLEQGLDDWRDEK